MKNLSIVRSCPRMYHTCITMQILLLESTVVGRISTSDLARWPLALHRMAQVLDHRTHTSTATLLSDTMVQMLTW